MMTLFNCGAIELKFRILVSFLIFFFIFAISLDLFLLGYHGNYTACCYLAKGRDFRWFFLLSGLYIRWAEMHSAVVLLYLKSDPSRCL